MEKVEKQIWQVKKGLPQRTNENVPSSSGNSMAQDRDGMAPQRVSETLISPALQGHNGLASRPTDRVVLSPVANKNTSVSKNGYSSPGEGNLPKNLNEMMDRLSKIKANKAPVTSVNKYNALAGLEDDASATNEVMIEEDDGDPEIPGDPLDADIWKVQRKTRAASAGVRIAVQSLKGNRKKSKGKMVAGRPASGLTSHFL